MKPTPRRIGCLLLALLAAGHFGSGLAQGTPPAQPAPATPPAAEGEDYQPKFIWGIVLKFAVNYAVSAFGSYMLEKLAPSLTASSFSKMLFNSKSASIVPLEGNASSYGAKTAGAPENTRPGEPTAPLRIENGRENYQAVHVSLMNFDRQGNPLGFHPVSDGFRSGDRFKLRVLPTFDGLLVIDNINPRGERKQIYPAQSRSVVSIKAGIEIMIPLGRDEYFEFAGATGDDQLVITLRDPRAFGDAAAKTTVARKDENNGSNFYQELAPGTYPVISQSLRFRHDG